MDYGRDNTARCARVGSVRAARCRQIGVSTQITTAMIIGRFDNVVIAVIRTRQFWPGHAKHVAHNAAITAFHAHVAIGGSASQSENKQDALRTARRKKLVLSPHGRAIIRSFTVGYRLGRLQLILKSTDLSFSDTSHEPDNARIEKMVEGGRR